VLFLPHRPDFVAGAMLGRHSATARNGGEQAKREARKDALLPAVGRVPYNPRYQAASATRAMSCIALRKIEPA
jgi:hypothetical protein